jgi:hydrogenase-4 component E
VEQPPLVGFGPSVVVAALLMLGFFRLIHVHVGVLAPGEAGLDQVLRTNLAVAATVFVLGLYTLVSRRDAIKAVIGLCLLENAVHLSLVSLAPALPETALFGVASEVVVAVFLLLYVIEGVYREFGTTDTLRLTELQW